MTTAARILCIVALCLCVLGVLCAVVVKNGGHVFGLLGEPLVPFSTEAGLHTSLVELACTGIVLILAAMVFRYGAELERKAHAARD